MRLVQDQAATETARAAKPVYAAFIKEQLDAQEARKSSLEARAYQLITVSATLVTLLFGLSALATRAQSTYTLPEDARSWIYGALVFFILTAVFAIAAAAPLFYKVVDPEFLMTLVVDDAYWEDESEQDAQQRTSVDRAELTGDAKKLNDIKAILVVMATVSQLAAVVCVAGGVYEVLAAAPVAN